MEGGKSPVAFNCSCDPRQPGAGHSVRCMLAPLCWCSQERFPSCPEQGLIQAQPGTDCVPASRPVHGAKWDRHQLGCAAASPPARDLGQELWLHIPLWAAWLPQPSCSTPPLLLLLPRLPSPSGGDASLAFLIQQSPRC